MYRGLTVAGDGRVRSLANKIAIATIRNFSATGLSTAVGDCWRGSAAMASSPLEACLPLTARRSGKRDS